MSLRPFLQDPAGRLILDTAAAAAMFALGLAIIANAGGSTWAPLIGGPAVTLAGAHLILLAGEWRGRFRPDEDRPPAAPETSRAGTAAETRSGSGR